MQVKQRHSRAVWLQVLVAAGGIIVLTGLYLLAMRAVLDVSRLDARQTASERDLVYLYLHTGVLAITAAAGFAAGKWLNGLGVAYAVLFVAVLATLMVFLQIGSYGLACDGHNDLIRHWTC